MFTRILIPTDGSEYSNIALKYALSIAQKLEAYLIGLCVIDIKIIQGPLLHDMPGILGASTSHDFIPLIEKSLHARADSILQEFRQVCAAHGLPFETKKHAGIVDEVIIKEGQEADIIVLAQRGEHYFLTGSGLLGSTSEAVVRKAGKPVLLTPLGYHNIERAGVAYNGSLPSERALRITAELAKKIRWPLAVLIVSPDHHRARILSERADSVLKQSGFRDYTIVINKGKKTEEEILKFTRSQAVGLIAMGAYGHSRFREMVLGSTTSYIMRKSAIPVLLVR